MSDEKGEDLNITKDQWIALLEDSNVVKEEDIELLKLFFDFEHCKTTALQLARQLDKSHYVQINNQVWRLGQRIVDKLHISAPKRTNDSTMWWHVPFWESRTSLLQKRGTSIGS